MINSVKTIAAELLKNNLTLSTAESCTGGLIGGAITDIAGASLFFKGGITAYSNEIKINVLGVNERTIVEFGAVSSQTVEAMVKGVCALLKTDCAISVSGIAGPGGGSIDKPVGLVYIGIKVCNTVLSHRHIFYGNRHQIRIATVKTSLCYLTSALKNHS
ncbi:MAG: CinA family protein [Fibrobacter sp.]|nr:CinA family protein [Fibrobacter sp.]